MKYVVIEMENGDVMKGELYPEIAPETVANFEKLVNEGFYDGLTFHRVIPGFMIQAAALSETVQAVRVTVSRENSQPTV